ncbi:MAG: hypothetical protein J0L57_02310 [Burkholderiales bacterium]|nr:hypothetical protein [Burkholderiales bacterium]
MKPRTLLAIQLLATLVIVALVPGNGTKLGALLLTWALTFRRIAIQEAALVVAVCALFTAMNAAALDQGIFGFAHPDILGMPVYELFMWGFYVLHTKRMIGGPPAPKPTYGTWVLAGLFAMAFATISAAGILLLVTAVILAVAVYNHHESWDLAYAGYMVALGAAVEYTGVHSGQWFYPDNPAGGVPLWFVTMWGGVGLFLRRLALPVAATLGRRANGGPAM